jgi:hypothetical protein
LWNIVSNEVGEFCDVIRVWTRHTTTQYNLNSLLLNGGWTEVQLVPRHSYECQRFYWTVGGGAWRDRGVSVGGARRDNKLNSLNSVSSVMAFPQSEMIQTQGHLGLSHDMVRHSPRLAAIQFDESSNSTRLLFIAPVGDAALVKAASVALNKADAGRLVLEARVPQN